MHIGTFVVTVCRDLLASPPFVNTLASFADSISSAIVGSAAMAVSVGAATPFLIGAVGSLLLLRVLVAVWHLIRRRTHVRTMIVLGSGEFLSGCLCCFFELYPA